jgi:hypothetical protein
MSVPYLSIGIPHCAARPERRATLARLLDSLGPIPDDMVLKVFDEPGPHWVWSREMWSWGLATDAPWFLQIQDDQVVPPNVLRAVRAMIAGSPAGCDVIGAFAVHPLGREIARQGGRWYRTRAWLMGGMYLFTRSYLKDFVPWVKANEARARVTCEDSLSNFFTNETGRDVFHPCPSLCEHDLSIPSTWMQQATDMGVPDPALHGNRRPTVSYKDFLPSELERAEFWEQPGGLVRLLPDSCGPLCWFCISEPAFISSTETGVHVGPNCFSKMAGVAAQRMLNR